MEPLVIKLKFYIYRRWCVSYDTGAYNDFIDIMNEFWAIKSESARNYISHSYYDIN